jgi:hypothetical protein
MSKASHWPNLWDLLLLFLRKACWHTKPILLRSRHATLFFALGQVDSHVPVVDVAVAGHGKAIVAGGTFPHDGMMVLDDLQEDAF